MKSVDAKFGARGNRDVEGGSQNAKRIHAGEVGVEGSRTLREAKFGRPAAIGKAELGDFQNGIFGEIRSRAIFKFNLGKSALRLQAIAFLQRQIDGGLVPGVTSRMRDEDLPFRAAQANDPDGIDILSSRCGHQR